MNDERKNNSVYVRHILDAVKRIGEYTKDADLAEFKRNEMLFDAVIRQFEIIGEATRRISEKYHTLHPEVPWSKMIAMRNFLAHDYLNIDLDIIWDTVKNQLPQLQDSLLPLTSKKK